MLILNSTGYLHSLFVWIDFDIFSGTDLFATLSAVHYELTEAKCRIIIAQVIHCHCSLQLFVYSKNVHTFLACWSPRVPAQGASLPSRHQTKQCSLSFQRPAQSQNKVIRLDNYGGEVAFDEDKHRIIIQTAFWFWLSSNMFLSQIDRFWACSWVGWDGQGEMLHGWHSRVHGTRGSRKYVTGQIELNLFSKLFRQSWRLPFIPSGDEVYFCKSCLGHVELGGIFHSTFLPFQFSLQLLFKIGTFRWFWWCWFLAVSAHFGLELISPPKEEW